MKKIKGVVVTTAGEISLQDFGEPLYKTVGAVVGGYIEVVHPRRLKPPYTMIVNEEGAITELPVNPIASDLYGADIHGNAVILKEGFVKGEPDLVGLSKEEQKVFVAFLNLVKDNLIFLGRMHT